MNRCKTGLVLDVSVHGAPSQADPWADSSVVTASPDSAGPRATALTDLVVSITGPGWHRETTSDAAGKYELTGLPTGPTSISSAASGSALNGGGRPVEGIEVDPVAEETGDRTDVGVIRLPVR
jgi:hypothetical protein